MVQDKTIGIFGYGNQGRSQALNMRDSGLDVIVGSRRDPSLDEAVADGFSVYPLAEAASRADILFLLVPDEVMPAIYEEYVVDNLKAGDVLVFASGYNIYYGHIRPSADIDVIMIAPRMIGHGVREHFLNGGELPQPHCCGARCLRRSFSSHFSSV